MSRKNAASSTDTPDCTSSPNPPATVYSSRVATSCGKLASHAWLTKWVTGAKYGDPSAAVVSPSRSHHSMKQHFRVFVTPAMHHSSGPGPLVFRSEAPKTSCSVVRVCA